MTVRAVVDDPIDLSGRIVLPRGAPARLEVVDVTRSPNFEDRDLITLRLLWIESRDRLSWVATNEVQFEGLRAHLRIPAETRMQFRLNTFAHIE
jgi:hypothetical protein